MHKSGCRCPSLHFDMKRTWTAQRHSISLSRQISACLLKNTCRGNTLTDSDNLFANVWNWFSGCSLASSATITAALEREGWTTKDRFGWLHVINHITDRISSLVKGISIRAWSWGFLVFPKMWLTFGLLISFPYLALLEFFPCFSYSSWILYYVHKIKKILTPHKTIHISCWYISF